METTAHLAQLAADGATLIEVATAADWDAPVPGISWSVREVVRHTGAVHRWAADLVREHRQANDTGGSSAWWPTVSDDALPDWFAEGLDAVVTTLATAPDDLEVWAFGRPAPAGAFWARRQAHETAVHRADVQAAAGVEVTAFTAAFAQDGLHELVGGFARSVRVPSTGRLAMRATDGDDWSVTFGDRIIGAVSPDAGDGQVDATVSGSSSDLYRWAWNRPSPAVVTGDPAVAALWREVRIT